MTTRLEQLLSEAYPGSDPRKAVVDGLKSFHRLSHNWQLTLMDDRMDVPFKDGKDPKAFTFSVRDAVEGMVAVQGIGAEVWMTRPGEWKSRIGVIRKDWDSREGLAFAKMVARKIKSDDFNDYFAAEDFFESLGFTLDDLPATKRVVQDYLDYYEDE